MKISKRTVGILSNFCVINPSIIIHKGSKIRTSAVPVMNTFASAEIEELFNADVPIYNLKAFLSVLSLFEDPDVSFTRDYVVISDPKSSCNFVLGDKSYIKTGPAKDPELPEHSASFKISATDLKSLHKSAAVLSLTDLSLKVKDNRVMLRVYDPNNSSKNDYVLSSITSIGQDVECELSMQILSNVMNSDYEVGVHENYVSMTSEDGVRYLFPTNFKE
jgi:hypothetical protein